MARHYTHESAHPENRDACVVEHLYITLYLYARGLSLFNLYISILFFSEPLNVGGSRLYRTGRRFSLPTLT